MKKVTTRYALLPDGRYRARFDEVDLDAIGNDMFTARAVLHVLAGNKLGGDWLMRYEVVDI
jgi:hypothetical protein